MLRKTLLRILHPSSSILCLGLQVFFCVFVLSLFSISSRSTNKSMQSIFQESPSSAESLPPSSIQPIAPIASSSSTPGPVVAPSGAAISLDIFHQGPLFRLLVPCSVHPLHSVALLGVFLRFVLWKLHLPPRVYRDLHLHVGLSHLSLWRRLYLLPCP